MRPNFKSVLIVPVLCLAASFAEAASPSDQDEDPAADLSAPSLVELGAFTFQIEQPRHVTYVVTRMALSFDDAEAADYYSLAERVVRLRDSVFDALLGIRVDAVTGELNIEVLQDRVERQLAQRLSQPASIEVRVLGTQDVPRR